MRVKSIFFSITLLFLISTTSISLAFFFFIKTDKFDFYQNLFDKYLAEIPQFLDSKLRDSLNTKERLPPDLKDRIRDLKLKEFIEQNRNFETYLKEITQIETKAKVLAYGDWVKEFDVKRFRVIIVEFEENFYIYATTPHISILLKDNISRSYNFYRELAFFLFIIFIFIISYIIILKKIYPLKILKDNIDRFADGDFNITFNIKSDDEISDVAKAFQRAVIKIDNLIKSRQLFLRNIMHELKTPITKGKFAMEFLEDSDRKHFFSIFNRMENLIRESSSIEQITSGELKLEKKEYRIIDILDEAIDISMQERTLIDIVFIDTPHKIEADFSYLSIAFKNLIDNAIKYSSDKRVIIEISKDSILFKNRGERLKKEFTHYLEAFSKEKSQGLGLGLYITDSIIKLHNFELKYNYIEESSIFEIGFA